MTDLNKEDRELAIDELAEVSGGRIDSYLMIGGCPIASACVNAWEVGYQMSGGLYMGGRGHYT